METLRLFLQAVIFSIVIHVIYIGGSLVHGLSQTWNFVPDIENAYENVTVLQNEVSFGYVGSPMYLVFTFIVMALIGAAAIQLLKRIRLAKTSV